MNRLKDKIAIVTGGSNGIGFATVKKFISEGASVIIWDLIQPSSISDLVELSDQNSVKTEFMNVNVTDLKSAEYAAEQVSKNYGGIDILINNAGITKDSTLQKMTEEQWKSVIDINLTGVFNSTKAVVPYMIEKKYGKIINASSVVGLYGNFGQTNYAASKAGVIGMTKVWARELGRKGITVNAVAPGFISTGMVSAMPDSVKKLMLEKTPLGRLGTPEDIANAYLFLASSEADFINGATLSVDGGIIT